MINPFSRLAILAISLACCSNAPSIFGSDAPQTDRRLQASADPRVEFNVPTANNPNITFFNFPYTFKVPDPSSLVANVPANVSAPIYNQSMSLPGSATNGNNLGMIVPPQNLKEIQFLFDDSCLLPIVALVTNNSTFAYQMTINSTTNSSNLKITNGKVLGPLGTLNTTVKSVNYTNLSRQAARDLKLFNVTYQVTNASVLNTSNFQIYCPMKASDAAVVTFTANFSNAYIGPAPANTTTTVLGPSDPNNVGLIIALVVGLGVPVFLLLCLLVWFIFCRSKKQYVPKPKEDETLPPLSSRAAAAELEVMNKPPQNHVDVREVRQEVPSFDLGHQSNLRQGQAPPNRGQRQRVVFGENPEVEVKKDPFEQE